MSIMREMPVASVTRKSPNHSHARSRANEQNNIGKFYGDAGADPEAVVV